MSRRAEKAENYQNYLKNAYLDTQINYRSCFWEISAIVYLIPYGMKVSVERKHLFDDSRSLDNIIGE